MEKDSFRAGFIVESLEEWPILLENEIIKLGSKSNRQQLITRLRSSLHMISIPHSINSKKQNVSFHQLLNILSILRTKIGITMEDPLRDQTDNLIGPEYADHQVLACRERDEDGHGYCAEDEEREECDCDLGLFLEVVY